MSDLFDRVTGDQNILQKLLAKIPGFKGYFEKSSRRAADKLLRQTVASRFEEQWQRISSIQRELISQGGIAHISSLESAAIKLRQFIDRVKTASYGYAAFFSAIKINEDELAAVYQYDLALLNSADEVSRAIDNVEASIGTDGLKAAIRHLTTIAQQCVEAFNKRSEAMIGGGSGSAPTQQ